MEYMQQFPNDAACLDWLWRERFAPDGHTAFCPKCDRDRRFHRVKDRPAYDCDTCGFHLHPTAGTIFHKSSTSLHLWFYAMYLIASTRCGVSAKQLERELGVTYKTAWRMLNLIRNQLMDQDNDPLSGNVEVDETYYGGRPRAAETRRMAAEYAATGGRRSQKRWAAEKKAMVFGMAERQGRVRARVLPRETRATLSEELRGHVLPESMIFTDEFPAYNRLGDHFQGHRRIQHRQRIYVEGDVHTNTIEGFFGLVKNGIRGTHHAVSFKWLQGYLNEYAWRYNRRNDRRAMFQQLLLRAAH